MLLLLGIAVWVNYFLGSSLFRGQAGTQCLGEGWPWLAKAHPLGTVGVSTQLSHPKQQLGAWGSSGAGHAVTHTSDTCLPSTGANPYWYGGVLVMLGWVGGASPARP